MLQLVCCTCARFARLPPRAFLRRFSTRTVPFPPAAPIWSGELESSWRPPARGPDPSRGGNRRSLPQHQPGPPVSRAMRAPPRPLSPPRPHHTSAWCPRPAASRSAAVFMAAGERAGEWARAPLVRRCCPRARASPPRTAVRSPRARGEPYSNLKREGRVRGHPLALQGVAGVLPKRGVRGRENTQSGRGRMNPAP